MTNEEGPENTPSRSPSSLSSDGVDELNKPLIRYKRNPRVLSSSNEEAKSSENPAEDGENRITSSPSSFIKTAKNDKPEIVPFKKRSSFIIYHNDDDHPSQSQLTTRESGCKLSADEEQCVEKKTEDENINLVVDDDISTKINDDDGGDGDNKTTEITPTTVVDDGKQADHDIIADTSVEKNDGNNEAEEQVQDVAMKDVVDESKEDQKTQVGYFVSLMMDDGDDVPDQLMEIKDINGGDNGCLTTNDSSKNGGNDDEEGQQAPMEDDDGGQGNNIIAPGGGEDKSEGKKPMEIDIPVVIHEGGSSSSKNSKMTEGGNGGEQEQVRPIDVVMEPEGGSEKGKEIVNANRSTNDEQGEIGQEEEEEEEEEEEDDDFGQKARKKLRISGSDEIIGSSNAVVILGPNYGGIGRDEPQVRPPAVQQVATPTRTIRLFGFDINPRDQQEHHVPIIMRNSRRSGRTNQATGGASAATGGATDGSRPVMHRVVMLFGVDISGGQEQPAAATGNGDGGSNSNHQPESTDGGHGC